VLGYQLRFAWETLQKQRKVVNAGPLPTVKQAAVITDMTRLITQVVISLIMLGTGCTLLFVASDRELHKIAYGMIGLVAGYWFR
jgi:hypothetical protein